jgi:hypothetical protein
MAAANHAAPRAQARGRLISRAAPVPLSAMPPRPRSALGRPAAVHPHQWIWEPLLAEPTFLLRPMFGGKSAYLDGRLLLFFAAKTEPWRGMLVCTERAHHESLRADFPALAPHPVLPKWLYLPETADDFERTAEKLVALARRRDPRIGIEPPSQRQPRRRSRSRATKDRP